MGRAVARVDNDLVRLQLAHIDVGEDVLHVFIEHVHLLNLAGHSRRCGVGLANRHRCNVLQPRVARDWARLCADELHAVVLLRIVARRDHDAPAKSQMRRREVDHLRAALADVHDITARLREPLCERVADRRTRETNVMSDGNLLRAEQRGETASDTVSELLVHLVGIDTAYIVCAKTFVCHCHVTSPPPWEAPSASHKHPSAPFDAESPGHNKILYNIG